MPPTPSYTGESVTRGELIASLDDDDFWIDRKVDAHVSALCADLELQLPLNPQPAA